MKKHILTKRCIICKEKFPPDSRVGHRQKVCKKLACKLQRKRIAQKRWCANNPDYFKGRYPSLKAQILKNQHRPVNNVAESTPTIQDEITIFTNKVLRVITKITTIQDELTYKITMLSKKYRRTIQDESSHLI
jgi:hypothetical protein